MVAGSSDCDLLTSDVLNMLKRMRSLNEKYLSDEEKDASDQQVEETVKTLCEVDMEMRTHNKALEDTQEQLRNNNEHNPGSVDELYKENLERHKASSSSDNNDFSMHPFYKTVMLESHNVTDCMEVALEPEEALTDADYDEINESISCSSAFSIPVDPISKLDVTEPYKNRKCGHVYQNGYIQMYINRQKNKARCPYIGCNNKTLHLKDLVFDEELQKQIEDFRKKNPKK